MLDLGTKFVVGGLYKAAIVFYWKVKGLSHRF